MTNSEKFTNPDIPRYFEDYIAGDVLTFGPVAVDEAEVIEFAQRYDPQDFHIDAQKASESHFGGLIASGWQTASLMMSLVARHYLSPPSSLGSPGIDKLRWLLPVRPGDELTVRVTITETRRSESKPDRGLVKSLMEVFNQNGQVVMDMHGVNFISLRT